MHQVERRCGSGEHDDTVEAQGDAGGGGHMGESGEEVFVERVAFAVDAFFLGHIRFEAVPLFDGVGEFAEAIREFDAAGIEFEALGGAGVVGGAAGEGGFGGGVSVEDRGAAMAEVGFDFFNDQAGEQVGPCVVGGSAEACGFGCGAEGFGVAGAVGINGIHEGDARVALDGVCDREAFWGEGGVAGTLAPAQRCGACGLGGEGEEAGAVLHQHVIAFACAIPFQHGEFVGVFRAVFAIAPDMGEGEDLFLSGGEEFLHREFGGGVEVAGVAGAVVIADGGFEGVEVGFVTGAHLHRVGIDLEEAFLFEPGAEGFLDAVAGQKGWAAIGVAGFVPPRGLGNWHLGTFDLAIFAPMRYRHRECAAL